MQTTLYLVHCPYILYMYTVAMYEAMHHKIVFKLAVILTHFENIFYILQDRLSYLPVFQHRIILTVIKENIIKPTCDHIK